jgi:Asp-tRNA(Asn)/Glu-tRNA(Gln) amidotransferase A subunit family amidase
VKIPPILGGIEARKNFGSGNSLRLLEQHLELNKLTAREIWSLIDRGEASAAEVCSHYVENIERHDPQIKAYLHRSFERARQQAARIDQTKKAGEPLPV